MRIIFAISINKTTALKNYIVFHSDVRIFKNEIFITFLIEIMINELFSKLGFWLLHLLN